MKRGKSVLKCICFIAIFAVLFVYVQEVLRDKWADGEYNPSTKIKGFYAEEKNSLEVVFIGSSQVYADIAPAVLFHDYGITSYDFCANEQPIWISYYYIKEVLKHQDPKVIVLDVFTVYGADYEAEGVTHFSLDDLPMSFNKIEAINASVPPGERYAYYFPIAKYHNTWVDLSQRKTELAFYHEKDPYKGYSPFVFAAEYAESAKPEVVMQTECEPIPDRALLWLNQIVDLCEEEGVDLLLTKTPNGHAERQKLYNSVAAFAQERDIPFYNMNVLADGQAHVNVIQAEKISQMMGDYLVAHYDLEDYREDPAYLSWHEDAQLFYRQKAKCELISAATFEEYVTCLQDAGYVVCISAKNSRNIFFDSEKIKYLNDVLGVNCHLDTMTQDGYAVILDGGNVIAEGAQINESIDMLDIHITSPAGGLSDMSSNIYINGTDFSMDVDGFNIVVYDKLLGEVFEMAAFDANNEMTLLRK
ncbi:MAG: hypothetical protein IJZ44_08200 [Lachnospiraceae bacterium]|nr:hypothetical protein [Lachnospiraceae bacterium]